MKKRRIIITAAAVCASAALLAFGLTFSFLTDREERNNVITIGSISLSLDEGDFPQNSVAAAGSVFPKAPKLANDGKNDEYVFIRVAVPKKNVTLLYEDTANGHTAGTPAGIKDDYEIFRVIADGVENGAVSTAISDNALPEVDISYNMGSASKDGWIYLEKEDDVDIDSNLYDCYYFGYNKCLLHQTEGEPMMETIPLFDKIQLKSFIDEELVDNNTDPTVKVIVTAYGIQSDNLDINGLPSLRPRLDQTQLASVFDIVKRKQVTA